jgi:phosphoglucosamine mutase
LHNLTIVVDCANGASTALAPKLFETLGARVIPINANPTAGNINLNSGSLHIESLMESVAKEKADLGVAFDGDADRSLSSTKRETTSTAMRLSGCWRTISKRTAA